MFEGGGGGRRLMELVFGITGLGVQVFGGN